MRLLTLIPLVALVQPSFPAFSCKVLSRVGQIWSVDQIVDDHGRYRPTDTEHNRQFIDALKSPDSRIWGVLHVDLANLKWQNDKGIVNKSVVDASENMYRKVLWEGIHDDPLLSYHLNHEFSDFKTGRFSFWEVPKEKRPDFEKRLASVVEKAGLAHAKYLRSYLGFSPDIQSRLKKSPKDRLDSEPGAWHTAGFATKEGELTPEESADLASLRARFAREDFSTGAKTIALRTGNEGIQSALTEVQSLRSEVVAALQRDPKLRDVAIEMVAGVPVPSRKVIEILRKLPANIRGDEIGNYLRDKFRSALGLEMHDKVLVANLYRLATLTDKFSPSINEIQRVVPRLEGDVVSIDIKGMGAVNLQELMAGLGGVKAVGPETEKETELVLGAIRAARQSEHRATGWINQLKGSIRTAALESKLAPSSDDIEFTGDDGAISLPKGTNPVSQQNFAARLSGEQFRVVMLRGKYSGNAKELTRTEKLGIINLFESVEKQVQEKMGIRAKEIALEIEPTETGKGRVRLWVGGKDVSPQQRIEIMQYVSRELPKGYELAPQVRVISKDEAASAP